MQRWPPFREAMPALNKSNKKASIGLISNVDDKLLGQTRRHINLDYDLVVTAQQVRSYKPDPAHFNVGTIAAACMLGYLDFRRQVYWRKNFPGVVPWLDAFRAKHPEYDATVPPDSP